MRQRHAVRGSFLPPSDFHLILAFLYIQVQYIGILWLPLCLRLKFALTVIFIDSTLTLYSTPPSLSFPLVPTSRPANKHSQTAADLFWATHHFTYVRSTVPCRELSHACRAEYSARQRCHEVDVVRDRLGSDCWGTRVGLGIRCGRHHTRGAGTSTSTSTRERNHREPLHTSHKHTYTGPSHLVPLVDAGFVSHPTRRLDRTMALREKEEALRLFLESHEDDDSRDGSVELRELKHGHDGDDCHGDDVSAPLGSESDLSGDDHDGTPFFQEPPQKKPATYAIAFMLAAQVFSASMNVSIRLLENASTHLHPLQILFVRMSVTALGITLWLWRQNKPKNILGRRENRLLLIVRAFGGFLGVFGLYCMSRLPCSLTADSQLTTRRQTRCDISTSARRPSSPS